MAKKQLNAVQQVQIDHVRAQAQNLREAKAGIEAEIRAEMASRLAAQEMSYALSIRRAYTLGVPKARIGVEGMGTKDPGTINRWLDKTAGLADSLDVAFGGNEMSLRWLTPGESIRITDYTMVDPWGSIEVPALNGVVDVDPLGADDSKRRSGYIVVTDQTPNGELTTMIEQRSAKIEGSLPFLLNEWAGQNR